MLRLSEERLDEIEAFHWGEIDCMPEKTDAEMRALIAMAKRTEAAERERDALRVVARIIADAGIWDWHTELSHWVLDGMPDDYDDEVIGLSVAEARAALAQPTLPTGAASRDAGGGE